MLRNFISSALSRSLSASSWQSLRISDKLPSLNGLSRPYSTDWEIRKERIRSEDAFAGTGTEDENLGFLTKVGILKNNFPNETTPDLMFDGVAFKHLPIVVCTSTKNNTKLSCHDYKGKVYTYRTSGCEGYHGAKRGTSVAAYVMSVTFGRLTRKAGVTNVRLCMSGFGRGRDAVLKGLKQTGLTVVSVTDITAIPYHGPRPKKARRV